jgi:CheY-like chemotaxis protein
LAEVLDILLVEDSPGDARLAAEAWKETGVPGNLHVVADQQGTPPPDLLLLDLNLPLKDGWEVLAEIKDDPALKRIPVIVLTTSRAETDILQSYDLHANCFIAKPVDLDGFIRVIRSIADFWGRVVLLPPR